MVTKLRMARVKTGLSLRAFAQANKLSESLLSKMETGKYYIPEKWRQTLAEALGLTVAAICDEKGWATVEHDEDCVCVSPITFASAEGSQPSRSDSFLDRVP